eukprot:scaffold159671_cov34-Tisochrysis_lutea.AAC.2
MHSQSLPTSSIRVCRIPWSYNTLKEKINSTTLVLRHAYIVAMGRVGWESNVCKGECRVKEGVNGVGWHRRAKSDEKSPV